MIGSLSVLNRLLGAKTVILGLPLLAVACAEAAPPKQSLPATAGDVLIAVSASGDETVGNSIYGDYLAGLVAGGSNDLSSAADFMYRAWQGDPENTELLRRAFYLAAADGRSGVAIDLAGRLLEVQPNEAVANLVLLIHAVDEGQFEEARTHLDALPDRGLATVSRPLIEAWLLFGEGKQDEALAALEELSDKQGIEVLVAMHKSLMLDAAGRTEEAGAAYDAAIEASGEPSLRLAWLTGNYLERNGKAEQARQLYDRFRERETSASLLDVAAERERAGVRPDAVVTDYRDGVAELLFNLAGLLSQERAEEIALIYTHLAIDLRPDFEMAQVLLGEILERQGRHEEAIATYRQIDDDSPFAWVASLRIADGLESLGRDDEAVAELENLAEQRPDHYEPLFRVGSLLRVQERYDEAVEAYDRGFDRLGEPQPQHWSLLYFRGIALERNGQWERAEADFLRALELEPEQPYVMNYLAYSWVEQKDHLDEALDMLRRAVELRPNDGYIIDSLGWVYYQLEDYDEATKYLERAVELRPQDSVINDHLGDAYWRVGRRQEARFQWRRALSLDPEPDTVAPIEAKIEKGLEAEPENI